MTTDDQQASQSGSGVTPDALALLMRERWSCRAFLPDRIERSTIEQMFSMAQAAASWCNSQPWQVIVTEGEGTEAFRGALYDHASNQNWADQTIRPEQPDFAFPFKYEGVYKERQRETGWALYRSVGIEHGDRAGSGRQVLENFRFFGAPHMAIITSEKNLGVYGAIDCGGFVANVLLAARSLGIATIAQAAIAGCAPFVRDYFGIPDNRMIVCGISFGRADMAHPANSFRTSRASVSNVIDFADRADMVSVRSHG